MSKLQRKTIITALIVMFVIAITLSFALRGVAFADGEYTRNMRTNGISVTCKATTIDGVYSDPVAYYETSAGGYLLDYAINFDSVGESDNVIYTANYGRTTTGRTGDVYEYVCEYQGAQYVVTSVNNTGDGATYIPVGGFVVSLNNQVGASFANVGDAVVLGGNELTIPSRAVESDKGARIVVDKTNTTRSGPMVVYYDYQFGEKTGTNIFGSEMTCTYDFDENTFKVVSFRDFGAGDDSGSDIPDNSFVLSAYGEGYRALLLKRELFNIGDEVKMVGFDFVRFGGTVYGEYDFVNPTPETNPKGMETEKSPFPAYRGENQTIIYKDGWNYNNASGTGTNVYGFEAAVDANGVVVELGVNVSTIPQGGYVISGHGSGRDFVRSNIVLGATVVLNENNKTYSVSTTLNSYYENLVQNVNIAIENASVSIQRLYDVDVEALTEYANQAQAKLQELKLVKEEIESGLESGGWSDEQRLSYLMTYNNAQLQVERLQRKIIVTSAESKTVSARAVWHRPTELSFADIRNNMQMYADNGFNMIFVETLYNGYSTFRSADYEQYFPYNPKLSASYADGQTIYNDYLSAFTACAGEYGIEVHAWVEDFYVGTQNTVPIVADHPDWVLYNDNGSIIQRNEGGLYIFLDPANKQVQDVLIGYYNDLFDKVPQVKGLNLDYIRYPVSDRAEDTGYTIAAMQPFAESKGVQFTQAQLSDRAKMASKFKQLLSDDYQGKDVATKNYNEWIQYRTDIITSFVKRIKNEVKLTNDIILSTSVFASVSESHDAKKQDWPTWFANGWIDIATPMAYYTDASDVSLNVSNMILTAGNNCYYYTGIASSYSGLPAYRNTEQIEASYQAGANGYVIFCSTQIVGHADVQDVLTSGVNSKTAVLPHSQTDAILNAYFDSILSKAQRLYITAGGMTQAQYDALEQKFNEIAAMDTQGAINLRKIYNAVNAIYANGISAYAKGYSGQRITAQLKELNQLLNTKISRALIDDGQWDPEQNAVRPTVTETEIIPYVPSEPNKPSGPNFSNGSNETTEPTDENNNVGLIVGLSVGGALLVAAAVAVTIILVKKSKKAKTAE